MLKKYSPNTAGQAMVHGVGGPRIVRGTSAVEAGDAAARHDPQPAIGSHVHICNLDQVSGVSVGNQVPMHQAAVGTRPQCTVRSERQIMDVVDAVISRPAWSCGGSDCSSRRYGR